MKLALKLIMMLAVTGYLVFALVKVSRNSDSVTCTGITVIIEDSAQTRLIDSEGVKDLLARHHIKPEGMAFGAINMHRIDSLLTASAYIDTAHCHRTPSERLCIRVQTKHPILHVMTDNGDEFFIDEKGHALPKGGTCDDLCIVTGTVSKKQASSLVELGKILQSDPYWKLQAQQVVMHENGKVELITRIQGHSILLGLPTDVAAKLQRARTFYEKGMPRVGWNTYRTINVAYEGQVICQK